MGLGLRHVPALNAWWRASSSWIVGRMALDGRAACIIMSIAISYAYPVISLNVDWCVIVFMSICIGDMSLRDIGKVRGYRLTFTQKTFVCQSS